MSNAYVDRTWVNDPIEHEFKQLQNARFGTPEWHRLKQLSDILSERDNTNELFQKTFGHNRLTPAQTLAIEQIVQGRDTLVVIPTGDGKSAVYQVSALKLGSLTVVISPLIALMFNQIDELHRLGIAATTINSSLKKSERTEREKLLCDGQIKLLYLAPESLDRVIPLLHNVSLVAVDESHCISQWGHDFRPKYRQLSKLREQFPDVIIAALTASATSEVRQDIIEQLQMDDPYIYIGSFDRPNLSFEVVQVRDKHEKFESLNMAMNQRIPSIVYTRTKASAEQVAIELQRRLDISALYYHAGMKPSEREEVQQKFLQNKCDVLVATIAFGMGINKPNVRSVIHYDIPSSMEQYHQETGRAGRDGKPAQCILLYNNDDIDGQEFLINRINSSPERHQTMMKKLYQMRDYAISGGGYREQILQYFR